MTIEQRAQHRGLHGHEHIARQRFIALLMIASGLLRVAVWALLIMLYLLHVKFARNLYASVSFVALLSVLALLLTDWGQVAASLAQLTAGDAHQDAEHNRQALSQLCPHCGLELGSAPADAPTGHMLHGAKREPRKP